jgi:hypothetical protein
MHRECSMFHLEEDEVFDEEAFDAEVAGSRRTTDEIITSGAVVRCLA